MLKRILFLGLGSTILIGLLSAGAFAEYPASVDVKWTNTATINFRQGARWVKGEAEVVYKMIFRGDAKDCWVSAEAITPPKILHYSGKVKWSDGSQEGESVAVSPHVWKDTAYHTPASFIAHRAGDLKAMKKKLLTFEIVPTYGISLNWSPEIPGFSPGSVPPLAKAYTGPGQAHQASGDTIPWRKVFKSKHWGGRFSTSGEEPSQGLEWKSVAEIDIQLN